MQNQLLQVPRIPINVVLEVVRVHPKKSDVKKPALDRDIQDEVGPDQGRHRTEDEDRGLEEEVRIKVEDQGRGHRVGGGVRGHADVKFVLSS